MFRLLVRRPGLLPAALGLAWVARRRAWYRRPPFLPLPPAGYLKWRLDTAFGAEGRNVSPDALARYLLWARRMRGGA